MSLFYLVLGTAFGFVLSRSGAADYDFIQQMLLLRSLRLYGVLGTAVLITALGLWALRRRGRVLSGQPLCIERKGFTKGTVAGAVLFGVGWSIAGMCPGPMFVNIGEGKLYAIASLAGAITGAWIFGAMYESLRKPFGLPPLARRRPGEEQHAAATAARGSEIRLNPDPTPAGDVRWLQATSIEKMV
jgi:uncharacterized membrane protein YedE/YeeE